MQNIMRLTGIAALLLLISVTACKHSPILPMDMDDPPIDDPNDPPVDTTMTGGQPCDSTLIYFEQDILPILVANCAQSGCHDQSTASDGVVLESYTSVIQSNIVDPFDLNGSDLYEVLVEDDLDKRMPPPPAAGLLSEQISLIAQWIQAGAQNLECDETAGGCDTENISYANDVVPQLQTYCLSCHSGNAPSGGLNLNNYSVVAQVANDGRLYGAIAHLPGYKAMPQGSNPLPECTIDQIKAWIDAGAPQN